MKDLVIARDEEIRNAIIFLSCKTKNNPCLIGESGVGKTAVVEGLAERIVQATSQKILKTKKYFPSIWELSLQEPNIAENLKSD